LKGSDTVALQARAAALGGKPQALRRCLDFLHHLQAQFDTTPPHIRWLAGPGSLGSDSLVQVGIEHHILPYSCDGSSRADEPSQPTTAADLRACAELLVQQGVDLLVFVGGDGTARDVLAAVGTQTPVLGIPAGVKMHSGVFAVSPRTAALLLAQLTIGGLVAPALREVRDYDDRAAEQEITLRSYGELRVPEAGGYMQQTKIGGKESEPLAVQEIVADVLENLLPNLPPQSAVVIGPGSTCLAIKQALGTSGTLRGVDVFTHHKQWLLDVDAATLLSLPSAHLVVSFSRAQGFLFGRGNQQISAAFLRQLHWPADVTIVGTRTKLASLEQQPLLLDTGDVELDLALCGLVEIVTGFEDRLLYRLAGQLD
jgi:predicted polyphosphate/ATP-dependent NAD kinase